MNLSTIISIVTLFLTVIISLLVLIENRRNKVNIYFGLLGFSIALWILNNILADLAGGLQMALLWVKMAIIWPAILPNFFFYLVVQLYYINDRLKYKKIFDLLMLLSSVIIVFSPTHLNVKSVTVQQWGIDYEPGLLYYLLFFHLIIGFGWAFYLLVNIYRISNRGQEQRFQAKYIFIGTISTLVLAIVANILLPVLGYGIGSLFGPPSVLLFIGFTAYAITKHHLFNIKVIATELLTFAIWIFILIQTLLADSIKNQFINGTLLLLVIMFGIFLIKSVIKEVEQREKLEVLTKELNATNERLVKLDKLKSEFLSFASHQVKTPITIVKGYASLIADGTYGQVSYKIKEIALRIVGASDRMVGLVNSILDSRKIEDGRMEYKFGEVEMVNLVSNVVIDLKSVAESKGLIFNIELPNEKLIIRADENKFRQVVQNILDNAIKYTDQGWVEVELEKKSDSLLLSVSDSGRGISKELLPRIFDQWTRDSKIVRNIQGTGLGLYIAKEIVIAHGGEIWAESRGAGEGSTFYVRLKLLR